MNIARYIKEGVSESNQLDYKDKRADNQDIAKELVALANGGGGTLILGVRETDGEIEAVQDVSNYSGREEDINNVIERRVEPSLDFEFHVEVYEGKTVVGLSVENQGYVHSFKKDDTPLYPVRQGSITGYMHGYEIYDFYRSGESSELERDGPSLPEGPEQQDELLRMPTVQDPNSFFIPVPDGHISKVSLFSDCYWPDSPVRVTARANELQPEEVENILASISDIFQFHNGYFTLNQSNAAWVGKGYENFFANVQNQSERYSAVSDDYDLDIYKTEQAVFIANLDFPFPESLLIVYLDPFTSVDGYRRVVVNFILDGYPADSSPLTEFAEKSNLYVANAHEETIPEDGIVNPTEIPVEPVEQVVEQHSLRGEPEDWVTGLISVNPFHNKQEILERHLDLRNLSPVSNYSCCLANFQQHHLVDDDCTYETQRFIVTDMDTFTEAMPITLRHIRFDVDWRDVGQ